MTERQLDEAALAEVARYFRVLAEPMRLKILNALHPGEKSVGQVVQEVRGNQANVSKHLTVLHDAGVLRRRSEGTSVFYSIADPVIFELCELVCGRLAARFEEAAAMHGRFRARPGSAPTGRS